MRNSKFSKIGQNIGEQSLQTFFKILKSISKSQNHQNWLSSPKFWRKFLKQFAALAHGVIDLINEHSGHDRAVDTRANVIPVIDNFL